MSEQTKNDEIAVPVVEEELVTGTRAVKTGSIRIKKRVERIRKSLDMPVVKDAVTVERVPVNRVVQTIPQMREERGRLIIPVVEEEVVVRRRLVLREEIHVVRKKAEERAAGEVTVAREHAFVERLDSDGKVIARSQPKDPRKSTGGKFFRQNGVL
jgi:uncharacterized protein (TIGR02271 family)